MIRLALYFEKLRDNIIVLDDIVCMTVAIVDYGTLLEMWIKCASIEALALVVEKLLDKGLLLRGFGNLRGQVMVVEEIDLEFQQVREFARYEEVIISEAAAECVKRLRQCIQFMLTLSPRWIRVKPSSNTIMFKLSTGVKVQDLFDNGLRLIKPFAAPPRPIHAKAR